jgi:hypothetical protein
MNHFLPFSSYARDITISGLLFLHRISDNRMSGTPLKNLMMFQKLCGTAALMNVILVTTMWDTVDENTGLKREQELRSDFWKSMLELGCRMVRFDNNFDSAWGIVKLLTDTPRIPLALQVEMVDKQQRLPFTAAGSSLFQYWTKIIAALRDMIHKLEEQLKGSPKACEVIRKDLESENRRLQQADKQMNKLNPEHIPRSSFHFLRTTFARKHRTVYAVRSTNSSLTVLGDIPEASDEGSYLDMNEDDFGQTLSGIVGTLKQVQSLACLVSVPYLPNAIGLMLTVAQSLEVSDILL